jgi:5-formyltetrahydrofolate cyclo-ligase
MLTKEEIRSKILLRLRTQKEDTRDRKSRIIKKQLLRTKVFKKAKVIMFYVALEDEVNTEEMIKEARKLNKIIVVPVCKKNRITIRPCMLDNNTSLRKGPYGVCEPAVKKSISLKNIDLVIVPGVAFDKKGNRLGRGKGCYDRFLKTIPKDTPSIGLAFDFQIIPSIPAQKHDVNVNKLIFA